MRRRLLLVGLVFCVAVGVIAIVFALAPGQRFDERRFRRVIPGMSAVDVELLLGSPTTRHEHTPGTLHLRWMDDAGKEHRVPVRVSWEWNERGRIHGIYFDDRDQVLSTQTLIIATPAESFRWKLLDWFGIP